MGGAVVIAKGDQGAKFQFALRFRGTIDRANFIFAHRGVFTMDHEDALFDFEAGDLIDENRKRVQAEFL
jgi:hypothetical protein